MQASFMLYPQRQVFTVPLGGATFFVESICLGDLWCKIASEFGEVCYITAVHMLICYKDINLQTIGLLSQIVFNIVLVLLI